LGPRAGDDVTEVDDGKEVGVAAAVIVIGRLAAVAVVVFDVEFVLDSRDGCLGLARGLARLAAAGAEAVGAPPRVAAAQRCGTSVCVLRWS
jgi:hypothetical protein